MNSDHGIEWQVDDDIASLVLNRPESGNAIGLKVSRALTRAVHELCDSKARVLVLRARGSIFCAGGQIDEFVAAGDRLDLLVSEILSPLLPAIHRLATLPIPVVTAVNGAAGGAGIALALCGDFVLAGPGMKLRTGYAAVGLSPDLGASYFLAHRVGPARARQWLMSSETIGAQRCLEAGAADALHDEAGFEPAVQALLQRLARAAPASMAAIKRLTGGLAAPALEAHLALERAQLEGCARSADAREGVAAFLAKRTPQFSGC